LDGQTVLAKGAYVTLSDVLHYKCKSNVKSIEIFASEEVLMDADIVKVGEEMQVRILAPRWRVTAPRKIILNGAPGSRQRPQRAADGHRPGYGGRDGKPGLPGGNAGSYFGISKEFIKNKIVIYSPIGGCNRSPFLGFSQPPSPPGYVVCGYGLLRTTMPMVPLCL
jgi:hypothetical protein